MIEQQGVCKGVSSAKWVTVDLPVLFKTSFYTVSKSSSYYTTAFGTTVNLGTISAYGGIFGNKTISNIQLYMSDKETFWNTFGY